MQCITPYCKNSHVVSRAGAVSRTPGFHPDYECLTCGARWLDTAAQFFGPRRNLRDLHEAVKEYRASSGDIGTHTAGVSGRAGRRAP